MNCKVSQQVPVLSVDASPQKFHKMNCKVSQQRSGLVSRCFTAKVSQNELIAKFRSKGTVLSVDASPAQQRSSNVSVDNDVYLVLEILGLFSAGVTAQAAFHKLSLGVRYIGFHCMYVSLLDQGDERDKRARKYSVL